jgi:hypothetical protein
MRRPYARPEGHPVTQRDFNISLQACRSSYVGSLHHWLLLSPPASAPTAAVGQLDLPVHSHVTVARQAPDKNLFTVQSMYRIKDGLPLISTPPHDWCPGRTLPRPDRRDNYRGITLNAATVVGAER